MPDQMRVLAVSNDLAFLNRNVQFFRAFGYEPAACHGANRCLEAVRLNRPDVIVVDVRPSSGLDTAQLQALIVSQSV